MKSGSSIIFCTRLRYDDPHWYANIGYFCDDANAKAYPGNGKPDISKLHRLDLESGQLTVLLDAQGGCIRDPQVHYDGDRIVFSYRKAGSDYFHLYEINVDGTGLRQITRGEFDDYEPVYLPNGDLVFVSTRCRRWVNCWMTQVGTLYRCDANGGNLRQISGNTEHDNTPWVLPDGRILYTRWEYVDRSQVEFHHLWAMNPDGTGQSVFYGNMHPHILMIDAKPVPGSDRVLANFSPGHGVNEHAGIATLVSTDLGPDDRSVARPLHKGRLVKDPYPLTENLFLAARDNQVLLMDAGGKAEVLYTLTGEGGVHEPRPLLKRERERILTDRADWNRRTGRMVLADVYSSRNLEGVRRGEIKKLLVLESLPKPVNFSGGPDLTSWLGTFTLERVLGTVPVEEDGSACFDVPANRQFFFVALDEKDLSVKRMQSFTSVMPGETLSCVGCHEHRVMTPENRGGGALQALRRPPSRIEPFTGFPDVLDFTRDIQPVLDRHCVPCHGPEKREGQTVLTGDLGAQWSHAYFSLLARRQVADGHNGLGNRPPRTIGSSASPLLAKLDGSHHDVKVSAQEWRTVWLWIESGAPFAGSYAGLRNAEEQATAGRAMGQALGGAHPVMQRRCASCHVLGASDEDENPMALPFNAEFRRKNRSKLGRPVADYERIVFENDPLARFSPNILVNFTRPHLSALLLGPLAKEAGGYGSCGAVFKDTADPDYRTMLAAVERGRAEFAVRPRYGMPDFRPNAQYVRELKKYGVLPVAFDPGSKPLDIFQSDQAYWRSLWHLPALAGP